MTLLETKQSNRFRSKVRAFKPCPTLAHELLLFISMNVKNLKSFSVLLARWGQVFLVLCFVLESSACAQVLPISRTPGGQGGWTNSVGIPGGVPNRTTIFCNVLVSIPGSGLVASGNDISNDTAAIQAAMNLCPSGEVVYLPTATYYIGSTLTVPSGITLRGNGMGNTILDSHCAGGPSVIRVGISSTPAGPSSDGTSYMSSSIGTADVVPGTNSVTLLNPHGYYPTTDNGRPVDLMLITITNDTTYNSNALVDIVGSEGEATWDDGGTGWGGTRVLGQIVEVTNISSQTYQFQPSPYLTYSNSVSPLVTLFASGGQWAGVENLTVKANNTGAGNNFEMDGAKYCWIKNVEGDFTDGNHVELNWCYRCEVRDSYFHDAWVHTPGDYDADVCLADKSSACLVENNILWRLHSSILLEWGAAGNVVAYNFSTNDFDSGGYNLSSQEFCANHGAHPMFNLLEGNVGGGLHADSIWGSSSDGTVFRNYWYGMGCVQQPLTGGGLVQWTNYWIAFQGMRPITLDFESRDYNIIGNVIGDDWMRTNSTVPGVYMVVCPTFRGYDTASYIYNFGYSETTDSGGYGNDNALPYASSVVEGNYDYVTQSTIWTNAGSYYASGSIPVALPSSLYLTNKPSWWNGSPWPPIGPDVTGLANVIPAQSRFAAFVNPLAADPPSAPSSLMVRIQ